MSIKNTALLLITILILTAVSAHAHRLQVDWRIGKIEIESFYGGSGTPCQDAGVKIYTSDGKLLEEGETDKSGKYSFSPLIWENKYKVVLESTHMPGHREEKVINLKAAGTSGEENEELPLLTKVLAGLGYLVGLAGISSAYVSWREKRKIVKKRK